MLKIEKGKQNRHLRLPYVTLEKERGNRRANNLYGKLNGPGPDFEYR